MIQISYKSVIVYTLITFIAIRFHESPLGLLLTFPQCLLVFYYLLKCNLLEAYKWHLVFSLTCLAVPFSSITDPGQNYALYNYSKFKLVGPVSLSLLISCIILTIAIFHKKKIVFPNNLFTQLNKLLIYLSTFGIFVGVIGLFMMNYNIDAFITFTMYIVPLIINGIILLLLDSDGYKVKMLSTILELLISSPLASLLCLLTGFFTTYSADKIIPQNELEYYSSILIFSIFYMKKCQLPLCAGILSFLFGFYGGTGGKGIITNVIFFVFFLVFLFKGKELVFKRRIKITRIVVITLSIICFSSLSVLVVNELFLWKLYNVVALFDVFQGMEGIDLIPNSPKIRIVSMIDILYPFKDNPIKVLLGTGYGGYFYDYINGFATSDLSHAFSQYEISTGRFSRPHDTLAAVPLVNGIVGLWWIVKLSIFYIKRYQRNFLSLATIPWLLLTFYYNPQYGLVGLIMLYVSDLYLNKNSYEN